MKNIYAARQDIKGLRRERYRKYIPLGNAFYCKYEKLVKLSKRIDVMSTIPNDPYEYGMHFGQFRHTRFGIPINCFRNYERMDIDCGNCYWITHFNLYKSSGSFSRGFHGLLRQCGDRFSYSAEKSYAAIVSHFDGQNPLQ